METRRHINWTRAFIAFTCLLAVFVAIRAAHPDRWSAFSFGDAYILQGGRNLAEDGFAADAFLGRYTPGPKQTAIDQTFYTHYPNIHTIISGLVQKAGVSIDNRLPLKLLGICLSLLGLVFFYFALKKVFTDSVAFLICVFTGVSPAFLLYVDSFTSPTYDFFFRNGFIACFLIYELSENRRAWIFAFGLIFLFLQSLNSFDYILFLQIFAWGFYLFNHSRFSWQKVALIAGFPLFGCMLHFAQVAAFFGSVADAVADFTGIFLQRSVVGYEDALDSPAHNTKAYLKLIDAMLAHDYGFGVLSIISMIVFVFLSERRTSLVRRPDFRPSHFILLNILGTLAWWVPFVGATTNLCHYTIPYMSLSFLGPLLGVSVVAAVKVLTGGREAADTGDNAADHHFAETTSSMMFRITALIRRLKEQANHRKYFVLSFSVVTVLAVWTLLQAWNMIDRSTRYVRTFPNLKDIGLFSGLPKPYDEHISLAKNVRFCSAYGDIILSDSNLGYLLNILSKGIRRPDKVGNPLYHHYSQREWYYFDVESATPEMLLEELCRLSQHREARRSTFKYLLLMNRHSENKQLLDFLDFYFHHRTAGTRFVLYDLDRSRLPKSGRDVHPCLAFIAFPSGNVFSIAERGSRLEWRRHELRTLGNQLRDDSFTIIAEGLSGFQGNQRLLPQLGLHQREQQGPSFDHAYVTNSDRLVLTNKNLNVRETGTTSEARRVYRELLFGFSENGSFIDKTGDADRAGKSRRARGESPKRVHADQATEFMFLPDPRINDYSMKEVQVEMAVKSAEHNREPVQSTVIFRTGGGKRSSRMTVNVPVADTDGIRKYSYITGPLQGDIKRLMFYPTMRRSTASVSRIELLGYDHAFAPVWPTRPGPGHTPTFRFSDHDYEVKGLSVRPADFDYMEIKMEEHRSPAALSGNDDDRPTTLLVQIEGAANTDQKIILSSTRIRFVKNYLFSMRTLDNWPGDGRISRVRVAAIGGRINPGLLTFR